MAVRNSAKAIIMDRGKILVNKIQNTFGSMCYGLPNGSIYYDLPGGGQNQYETLEEAVIRECLEETGYSVIVDRLAALYEEISDDNDFRRCFEAYAHKIHFIFICHLSSELIQTATEKDLDMVGSEWVSIESISSIPLYPMTVKNNLCWLLKTKTPIFLGSERVLNSRHG